MKTLTQHIASLHPWVGLGLSDVRDHKPSFALVPFAPGEKRNIVHLFVKHSLRADCVGSYRSMLVAKIARISKSREEFRTRWSALRKVDTL